MPEYFTEYEEAAIAERAKKLIDLKFKNLTTMNAAHIDDDVWGHILDMLVSHFCDEIKADLDAHPSFDGMMAGVE